MIVVQSRVGVREDTGQLGSIVGGYDGVWLLIQLL